VRAALAYGRQLTCSPDCESERRSRMRDPGVVQSNRPVRQWKWPSRAMGTGRVLESWAVATVAADMVRTAAAAHDVRSRKR
jgi:hypothetical protein